MSDHLYEIQWWDSANGCWKTDFTSNDVHHIQQVFTGRQKPIQNKIRVCKVEDVTRFFDL